MQIWKDRTDTFKQLPPFLDGQYFFRTPTKGNKNNAWTIQVNGPSTIYVVTKEEKTKSVGKRATNGNGIVDGLENTANNGQQEFKTKKTFPCLVSFIPLK